MLFQPVALDLLDPDASVVLPDATFNTVGYHPCHDESAVLTSVAYFLSTEPRIAARTEPVIVPIPDHLALEYGVLAFQNPNEYRDAMIAAASLVLMVSLIEGALDGI